MTNTQTQTNNKNKAGAIVNNKWLSEFADITVDEKELEGIDATEKPKLETGELSFQEIFPTPSNN